MNYDNSEREIYHTAQCASCILEVALKYYNLSNECSESFIDAESKLKDTQKIMVRLSQSFIPNRSPNEIANELFLYAAKLGNKTGTCEDPWEQIRTHSNEIALEVVPIAQKEIDDIKDPKKQLFKAIEWSIVGNNLDFGTAGHEVNLGKDAILKIYDKVLSDGFRINDFEDLWNSLNQEKKCLYLLDNAGEIVFDKLVINQLVSLDIDVKAVVKGAPISNDATMKDSNQINLGEICDVISTGSADLGFDPNHNSKEFIDILNSFGLVIAKGQANWEATYAYQDQLSDNIKFFNILKIKCDVHANLTQYPKGSNFIMLTKKTSFK